MARLGLLAIVILGGVIAVVSGVFSGDSAAPENSPAARPESRPPPPPFATNQPLGQPRGFYFTQVRDNKPLEPGVCCLMITPRITEPVPEGRDPGKLAFWRP